jgi:transketolase
VSIFATGMMTAISLRAAELLVAEGFDPEVVHLGSIKPVDTELIAASAARTGCAVTAENHSINGGLGSAVAEVLVERRPVPMLRIGYQDKWLHSGSISQVLETYHLRPVDVADAARRAMGLRTQDGVGRALVTEALTG